MDNADNELSGMMRQLLRTQYAHLLSLREQLAELEGMLKVLVVEEEAYQHLMQIPGVGLITATLLGLELGNGTAFRNGRSFAAYLGLTPRQQPSDGKNILQSQDTWNKRSDLLSENLGSFVTIIRSSNR